MGYMKDKLEEAKSTMETLGKDYPRLMGPFGVLKRHTVETEGALSVKVKKLIALSVALAAGCSYCLAIYTRGALEAGATKDEIVEACFSTVLMAGGPALTHMKMVLDAIEEFSE